MGSFVILWALAGSSRFHKTWPHMDAVLARLMLEYEGVDVILCGGPETIPLQAGWENEPRIHKMAGQWPMRMTLAMLDHVDLVIGPETGVLNAAADLPLPKVVFLSHSTHENLTRDWKNTTALAAESVICPGRGENEAPACHMMHYTPEHCRVGSSCIAVCQEAINPAGVFQALARKIPRARLRPPPVIMELPPKKSDLILAR
jgi:ADP-heptose:LPS heptosyltransferase